MKIDRELYLRSQLKNSIFQVNYLAFFSILVIRIWRACEKEGGFVESKVHKYQITLGGYFLVDVLNWNYFIKGERLVVPVAGRMTRKRRHQDGLL